MLHCGVFHDLPKKYSLNSLAVWETDTHKCTTILNWAKIWDRGKDIKAPDQPCLTNPYPHE